MFFYYGGRNHGCGPKMSSWKRGPFEFSFDMGEELGRRGRGGRRRRMFDGDELRLVLLKLIADQPRHGYDLIRDIEERTGGAYAPSAGVVYPTLTMLDEMGQIEAVSEGSRRQYAATDAGRAHLAEREEEVAELIARLDALGEERNRVDRAPIRRATANLFSALAHRVARGDTDTLAHEIAEVIDEAARRIERL
ncbi:helix-turn-helix transcriptional regulator [Sphingomonas sp. ID1715]|uniref:PadR family transcriptional regulator n=1 Tax=Sphingomonas sp. ID1715 TaxID=1656898 RepID=UPI001489A00E|nr:PadR family transcriptional regulator [Sphingomonas sp. ID1715]NNM75852.1 helix-turn-helix transcriptional regulator [Sphingomonas sp. ID1715]